MLSDSWLNIILQRIEVAYPGRFPPRAVAPELVRAEWAHELDGMGREDLQHGMANLPPDYPPNALQFKVICQSRPRPVEMPPPGPKRVTPSAETKQQIKTFSQALARGMTERASADPLAWARQLKAKEEAGEELRPVQARAWREALGRFVNSQATQGESDASGNPG